MNSSKETPKTGFQIDSPTLADLMKGIVAVEGDAIALLAPEGKILKRISIDSSRKWILSRYNWTGIILLCRLLADQTELISFSPPSALQGTSADDLVLLPDEIIAYLIYLQYNHVLCNQGETVNYVDGKPGNGTLFDLFGYKEGRISFMVQTKLAETDPILLKLDIFDPKVREAFPDLVYDEIRKVVRRRNGLFSDEDRITNVVGIRYWDDSNFSNDRGARIRLNDHFFVLYQEGGEKKVFHTRGTTDPGQVKTDGHLHSDQTMTLTPGWHQSFQAAGRTGNVLRQQNENGEITFREDTGMNFHKANSIHRLRAYNHYSRMRTKSKAQVHTNVIHSGQEKEIYFYISKLQRTLIGMGRKWADLSIEQQDEVHEIFQQFKTALTGYKFHQGYARSGYSVGEKEYCEMVEGWIQSSDWSYDPNSGNVTQAFSDGCQVFENTGDYARFMWSWQQFAFGTENGKTRQERWYYNLLDSSSLQLDQDIIA